MRTAADARAPTRRRPLARPMRAALLLLALVLAAPLLIPPVGAFLMAYPPVRDLGQRPEPPYEDVAFPSAVDGALLSGWYLPAAGDGGRCIIIVHGFLNDRQVHGRGLPLALALRAQGFDVLLFDLRGQGRSGGGAFTFGAREQWDVAGAVRFVRERGARHIGLLGYSSGAFASILAAADDPGIDAVVADSALADLHAYLEGQVLARSHLGPYYAEYALTWYRWLTRSDERVVRPAAVISRLAPRPVLLIHGMADRVIPVAESQKLLAAAEGNPRAELWLVPGGRHTHSYEADPAAYVARVVRFLAETVTSR